MSDLIRRSALLEEWNKLSPRGRTEFDQVIMMQPSVEPVRGGWVHIGGDEWCCSNCGYVISTEGSWEKPEKKFCEECGADMRKKVEE